MPCARADGGPRAINAIKVSSVTRSRSNETNWFRDENNRLGVLASGIILFGRISEVESILARLRETFSSQEPILLFQVIHK